MLGRQHIGIRGATCMRGYICPLSGRKRPEGVGEHARSVARGTDAALEAALSSRGSGRLEDVAANHVTRQLARTEARTSPVLRRARRAGESCEGPPERRSGLLVGRGRSVHLTDHLLQEVARNQACKTEFLE